jgi:hypothetical protein
MSEEWLALNTIPAYMEITLGDSIKSFSASLSALRDFVQVVSSFLDEHQRKIVRDHRLGSTAILLAFNRILKDPTLNDEEAKGLEQKIGDRAKITVLEKGSVRIQIDEANTETADHLVKVLEGVKSSTEHQRLLYRSALISLISSAEWFLSQVIRQHLVLYSDAAGSKEKKLSLDDLKKMGSIEDATRYLIDTRIDELMWGGFGDWVAYLTEKMKLSLGYLKESKPRIVEVFQRRNVMVHNNGLVHSSYISNVTQELRENTKIGEQLSVSPLYLSQAIDLIEMCFILIGAELWKQLAPNDENRGTLLIEIAFDRLQQERWEVAEKLSFFLMQDKRLPERDQLVGTLNYWQSIKWQNRFEEVRSAVESADFSAKDELYQAARLALLDNDKAFFTLLPDVLSAEKLDLERLAKWPIFKSMRESRLYEEFVKAHTPVDSGTREGSSPHASKSVTITVVEAGSKP